MLDGPPETLNPDVVLASAPAIHTDLYTVSFYRIYPVWRRVLAALVRIYYFRSTVFGYTLIQEFRTIGFLQYFYVYLAFTLFL